VDAALTAAGLADAAADFKAAYDVGPYGNWENRTILNRSDAPELGSAANEAMLAQCRDALLAQRNTRIPPGLDDKVLADWNGMMVAALAQAGATFVAPAWIDMATAAFGFVAGTMQQDGRLGHAWRGGRLVLPGTLDDHAEMARAALALHEATGEAGYLAHARDSVAVAEGHYWDAEHGGFFFTADDANDVITRTKSATDNATPAGNGTMVEVLLRLYLLTGETAFRERAEATLAAFAGAIARHPLAFATLLNAVPLLTEAQQVVIIGPIGTSQTDQLIRCFHGSESGSRTLQVIPYDQVLPTGHPAAGKAAADGQPTAYVCRGPVCSLPLTEPEALKAELARA